jgi:hypothetical protein
MPDTIVVRLPPVDLRLCRRLIDLGMTNVRVPQSALSQEGEDAFSQRRKTLADLRHVEVKDVTADP